MVEIMWILGILCYLIIGSITLAFWNAACDPIELIGDNQAILYIVFWPLYNVVFLLALFVIFSRWLTKKLRKADHKE